MSLFFGPDILLWVAIFKNIVLISGDHFVIYWLMNKAFDWFIKNAVNMYCDILGCSYFTFIVYDKCSNETIIQIFL